MTKCENCRWNIPDDASSCPYCGHRIHLGDEEEEEQRRRMLHWHMLTVMRQKRHVPLTSMILAVITSLVIVIGGVSVLGALSQHFLVVSTSSASPSSTAKTTPMPGATSKPSKTATTSVPPPCSNSPISPTPGAGTGTNLTFSGAVVGTMCVIKNDGCSFASGPSGYQILGAVNGTLYTFVLATGAFEVPRTYTSKWTVTLDLGDATATGPGKNKWYTSSTGPETITVNNDQKSGNVDALMNQNKNTSGSVRVTGTWACSGF